ncbi:MAG: HDOD domain-containing protein [Verrucomicrobia bacterium]|nr:HDOD domain-containing protein [Verrucomicrobiota bacterium]
MDTHANFSVLFVGKDSLPPEVSPQSLPGVSEGWQTKFASNAVEGFELLARTRFDVVVSDLHLPGIDGVEFLKALRERFPLAGRIVFSREPPDRVLEKASEIADRCLPCPCSEETLKATIEGVAAGRSRLAGADIRQKISRLERIPSLPKLYERLVGQLQSRETDLGEIADTISEDIGMTAQILKLVNSAYFGLPRPTSNVREVIGFLGTNTIQYLVLAIGIFRQTDRAELGGFPLDALWNHCARTATFAKLIAKCERVDRDSVENSTTAGLLHDVGQLVLASNYPEQYREVRRNAAARRVEWIVGEREAFGFDHAEVGGMVLGLWGLPAALVEAVTYHHAPVNSPGDGVTVVTAVHVANVLAQRKGPSYTGTILPRVDQPYLERIGRGNDFERWRGEIEETTV